jgi:cytochrome P450
MPHEPARVLQLDLFLGDAQAYRDALALRNDSACVAAGADSCRVTAEALRLFPPAAMTFRRTLEDHPVGE